MRMVLRTHVAKDGATLECGGKSWAKAGRDTALPGGAGGGGVGGKEPRLKRKRGLQQTRRPTRRSRTTDTGAQRYTPSSQAHRSPSKAVSRPYRACHRTPRSAPCCCRNLQNNASCTPAGVRSFDCAFRGCYPRLFSGDPSGIEGACDASRTRARIHSASR